jgi:hypothetical protein
VRLSESGKRYRRFFETKEQAQKFIFETKRSGSVELAELAVEEKHVLGVIRQAEKYEPRLLLEAWQRFEKEEIGDDRNLTVQELAEKFLARQKAQGRSTRTIIDDRSRLNALTKVLGHLRAGAVKRATSCDIWKESLRERIGEASIRHSESCGVGHTIWVMWRTTRWRK